MLLRFILKIWPALTPIAIYLFWVLVVKRILRKVNANKIIDAEFQELDKNGKPKIGDFSLQNKHFVLVIYSSLILMVICFLFFAINVPKIEHGKYVPAEIENEEIIPGKIIEE